nr:diacylglycerol kinase family protein [uncultured Caproiciproducens sp.]
MDKEIYFTEKRRRRVKLIFNPVSGSTNASPVQLMDIISMLQQWKFMPEVYLTEPDSDFSQMVKDTMSQGINMFVVCGGDGTISSVAKAITGLPATLGIIPTGTQNNIALSLNIPRDIPSAISILRSGERTKIDVGQIDCAKGQSSFLEICSVGLMSSLFSAGDDIQHGHLERVGDFLATLVSLTPSKMKLVLDEKRDIVRMGHLVLISNMPYVGRHYQVGGATAYKDGLLDVLIFSNLSKLNLLGRAFKGTNMSELEDSGIEHFHVQKVDIETTPAMQLMADGVALGEGTIHVESKRRALAVMMKTPEPKAVKKPAVNNEDI